MKDDVKSGARPVDVELDVGQQIRNEQLFTAREDMLKWVCMKATKLRFDIVIGRSDIGSYRRQTFLTMRCERSGTYVTPIRKLKRDDIRSSTQQPENDCISPPCICVFQWCKIHNSISYLR